MVDAEPLIQTAVVREDERFEDGADKSEGLDLLLRPPSPLTELESEDVETPDEPPQWMAKALGPASYTENRLILDREGRIFATLVGQPNDPEWGEVTNHAAAVMREVQKMGADFGHIFGQELGPQARRVPRHPCWSFLWRRTDGKGRPMFF